MRPVDFPLPLDGGGRVGEGVGRRTFADKPDSYSCAVRAFGPFSSR
jgi:hypothetical protein